VAFLKPSVLLVGNFLSSSVGSRFVCEDLEVHLKMAGWRVLVTSTRSNRLVRLLDMIATVIVKRKHYQVANVDIYSGLAFTWGEIVCSLLRLMNKPFLLTLHGGGLAEFAKRYPGRVKRLLSHAKAVTTPSHFLQGALQPFSSDIIYLPNAIHVSHYPYELRSTPSPELVWLRAFERIYHPEDAVSTLAILLKDFPKARLYLIGPDKGDGTFQEVEKLADSLRVRDKITFAGSVAKDKVPLWLNKGDIFLNTTAYESFGVSVIEAGAVGLPIVTTNVGELSHIWQDRKDAILVPVNDPQCMAQAVCEILTEPGLAAGLSRKAREKAERFDWANILPVWEDLFMKIGSNNRENLI